MKVNQIARIIIPLTILLGAATAFIVVALANLQVNASTEETQAPTAASSVMYLKVEGIDGEVIQADHVGWIEVLAYSHNLKLSYDADAARSAGSVEHAPLRVTKMVDKASPKLYQKCSTGEMIPSVMLDLCFNDATQEVFYQIELLNAQIVSVQEYGLALGDSPTETVSFVYESIRWIYTEWEGGSKKGTVESGWIDWEEAAT